jgi:hypothetical protein
LFLLATRPGSYKSRKPYLLWQVTRLPSAFTPLAMFVIDTVLPHLPSHLPTLLKSTVLFFGIQIASYTLSPIFFPRTLKGWSRKEKIEWSSRVVG